MVERQCYKGPATYIIHSAPRQLYSVRSLVWILPRDRRIRVANVALVHRICMNSGFLGGREFKPIGKPYQSQHAWAMRNQCRPLITCMYGSHVRNR
jgi:hypothetical protein